MCRQDQNLSFPGSGVRELWSKDNDQDGHHPPSLNKNLVHFWISDGKLKSNFGSGFDR